MGRYRRKVGRQAKRDAKEYARAKMFYGEGAGTRRKLINTQVKERSKDAVYKAEFERYLSSQNMAKHAAKARGERHRRDVVNTTAKTARGVKNLALGTGASVTTGALALYSVAKYTGMDKKVAQYARVGMDKARQFVMDQQVQASVRRAFRSIRR